MVHNVNPLIRNSHLTMSDSIDTRTKRRLLVRRSWTPHLLIIRAAQSTSLMSYDEAELRESCCSNLKMSMIKANLFKSLACTKHTRQRTTVRRQNVKTCGANSLCCSMPTLPRIMRAAIAHNIVASTLICNNFIGSAKRVVHRCTLDAPHGRYRTRPQGWFIDTPQGRFKTHLKGGSTTYN